MRALLTLLVGAFLCLNVASAWAASDRRVALVIGNSAYRKFPQLPNPRNDAEDVTAAMKRVGFTVLGGLDMTREQMRDSLRQFARAAQDSEAAFVFYAGHGLQYRGRNYLVPVDAKLEDEFDLEYETVRVDDVVEELNRADGPRILVLDACRNLPLATRSRDPFSSTGLAKLSGRGLIVAYATQANQVAYDGTGRNSIFTGAFVRTVAEPGLDVGQMFQRVSMNVDRATGGRQTPELSFSYPGQFYLNKGETEREAWPRARASNDPQQLRDFIARYPDSFLVEDAKDFIRRLEARGAVAQAPVQAERSAPSGPVNGPAPTLQLARRPDDAAAARAREEAERLAWQRLQDEQKRRADARQQTERERAAAEEAERQRLAAEEERRRGEARRLEQERVAEEARQRKLSEERAVAEAREKQRLDREAMLEEERRRLEARKAEQERVAEEARGRKLAEERAAADAREKQRLDREAKLEEERRVAEARRAEQERVVEARKAEAERVAEEGRQRRLAEERAAADAREKQRLEREAKLEEERRVAETRRAEQERVAEARKAEAERVAEEGRQRKLAEERAAAEARERQRLEREARLEEERRLAELRKAEGERLAAEARERQRLALEETRREEERVRLAAAEQAERDRSAWAQLEEQQRRRTAAAAAEGSSTAARPEPAAGTAQTTLDALKSGRAATPSNALASLADGTAASADRSLSPMRLASNDAAQPAIVTPPSPAAFPKEILDRDRLVRETKAELGRIGCSDDEADGDWDKDAQDALRRFGRQVKLSPVPSEPSADLLQDLKGRPARTCPLECGAGEKLQADQCVAVARPDQVPARKREPKPKAVAQERRAPAPEPRVVRPRPQPAPAQAPVSTASAPKPAAPRPMMGIGF